MIYTQADNSIFLHLQIVELQHFFIMHTPTSMTAVLNGTEKKLYMKNGKQHT